MNVEDNWRKNWADVSIFRIHDHPVELMARYILPALATNRQNVTAH